MKKKRIGAPVPIRALSKLWKIMRLSVFFLLLFVAQTFATEIYSQQTRLTLEMQGAKVIDVLAKIEDQSEFFFLFNQKLVDVDRQVSIDVKDENIDKILNRIFENTNVNYLIKDRQIVLTTSDLYLSGILTQQKSVSGKVTDSSGTSLPGVSVLVKGTNNGVITDMNGKYAISNIPENAILQYSFVGMKTVEIPVGNKSGINVTLVEESIGIDEVIAVGYQTKTKANLTGSVSTVNIRQLENRSTPRLTNLLAGTAPGLTITRSNPGRIGTSVDGIRIGGLVSRNDAGVLVVIDGIPQESSATLNQINPNDVASISVLKDAEAAVYGSRAAGGVIVITTKQGGAEAKIGFGYSKKFSVPNIYKQSTNMFEMFEMQEEGWKQNNISFFGYPSLFKYIKDNNITYDMIKNNDFKYVYGLGTPGTWGPFPDTPFLGFGNTNWMKLMYGTGVSDSYDFSMSGATEKTNYYISLGIVDEGSMLQFGKNNSKTSFIRSKFEYKQSDKLKAGTNIAMRYQNWVEPSRYDFIQNLISQKFTFDHPYTPEGRYMNWGGYQNPIGLAKEGGETSRRYYNIQAQVYVEFRPIQDLIINANVVKNANFLDSRSIQKEFMHYLWDESPSFGALSQLGATTSTEAVNQFNQSFTGNLTATYRHVFAKNHTIRALVGFSHEEFENYQTRAWRLKMLSTDLTTLNLGDSKEQYNSDAQTENSLEGLFTNISYSYKEKYIVEGSYRNDGSSRFAKGYKWKDFYSASAAWNVTNEQFVKNLNLSNLSNLKIRASWGQLGNQSGISLYDFIQRVNISQSNILLGNPASPIKTQTATISGFPALDRTWEIAEKSNFGFDLGMYKDQLTVVANVFSVNNSNIFYSQEFPAVLGATPPSINGAEVKTNGWDLGVNWDSQAGSNFRYNVGFGISDAKTKAISLADSRNVAYGRNGFVEGYAVGTVFGFQSDGIIQSETELADYRAKISRTPWAFTSQLGIGDMRYKDLNGDGKITSALYELDATGIPTASSGDMVSLGDTERHYEFFINGGFSFKGIDFSFVLNGLGKWTAFDQAGQDFGYPWIQPLAHFYRNTWSQDRPDAHYPSLTIIGNDFSNHRNANNYGFSDASYMKRNVPYLAIKNIQLGYTIPKLLTDKIKTEKVYIYLNAADLGYLINKMPKSYSPEQPYNASLTPYPQTFAIGINVNF